MRKQVIFVASCVLFCIITACSVSFDENPSFVNNLNESNTIRNDNALLDISINVGVFSEKVLSIEDLSVLENHWPEESFNAAFIDKNDILDAEIYCLPALSSASPDGERYAMLYTQYSDEAIASAGETGVNHFWVMLHSKSEEKKQIFSFDADADDWGRLLEIRWLNNHQIIINASVIYDTSVQKLIYMSYPDPDRMQELEAINLVSLDDIFMLTHYTDRYLIDSNGRHIIYSFAGSEKLYLFTVAENSWCEIDYIAHDSFYSGLSKEDVLWNSDMRLIEINNNREIYFNLHFRNVQNESHDFNAYKYDIDSGSIELLIRRNIPNTAKIIDSTSFMEDESAKSKKLIYDAASNCLKEISGFDTRVLAGNTSFALYKESPNTIAISNSEYLCVYDLIGEIKYLINLKELKLSIEDFKSGVLVDTLEKKNYIMLA